ncbi:hypothetical protein LEMLEM_LOCUS24821 [Lemmus lemmus]
MRKPLQMLERNPRTFCIFSLQDCLGCYWCRAESHAQLSQESISPGASESELCRKSQVSSQSLENISLEAVLAVSC